MVSPPAGRRCHVLCNGLGDREEHQVDSDARCEEHGGPCEETEARLGVVWPEFDAAGRGKREHNDERDNHARGQDVVPPKRGGGPADHGGEYGACARRNDGGPDCDNEYEAGRSDEYGPLDLGPIRS